jgi:DNA ligase-1
MRAFVTQPACGSGTFTEPSRHRIARTLGKAELPARLARWLDALDETGRWALIKLVTGGCASAVRHAWPRPRSAALGAKDAHEIELLWPGLSPPYHRSVRLARRPRREARQALDPAPFRPPMLAHALDEPDLSSLEPVRLHGRMEVGRHPRAGRERRERARRHYVARLYSRTGENITRSFPDLVDFAAGLPGAIDGELLIMRDHRVQSFNVLQQRLNRKSVTAKAAGRVSRASARLRSSRRRRRRFARPPFAAPRAA